MIQYQGEKVRLRPLKKTDIEKSVIWRNDPEIRDNLLGFRFPVTEKMETNWIESALDDRSNSRVIFAMEAIENDQLIGFIYLNKIDWIARLAYFGILIGEKNYHGMGIGSEAMKILFTYAFDALNLRKICLEVASYNRKAIDLYQRFGFQKEGSLRQNVYLEGKYHDLVIMGIFGDEFKAKHIDKQLNLHSN